MIRPQISCLAMPAMTSHTTLHGHPVIDLSRLDASPAEKAAFYQELRTTSRDAGFFYLTGHGISQALVDQVFALSRQFFDLPDAEKLAIEMVNSPHFRGYTRNGGEYTRGEIDWREQLDIGAERPTLPQEPGTPLWARLQGPNQWPTSLPDFKSTLLRWQQEQTDVAIRLLRAFAVALGQSEDFFDPIYQGAPNQHVKVIRYPGRHDTSSSQGVGPHKDSGLITMVMQHEQSGLQVETEQGWLDAPPVPGTFVVNIGELLELASNGYLRGTVHQVVTPPAGTDRLSTAFFLGPRLDSTIPLIPLPTELAGLARGAASDPLNPLFLEVGRNYLKGRLRSHPDVAKRFYADVPPALVA